MLSRLAGIETLGREPDRLMDREAPRSADHRVEREVADGQPLESGRTVTSLLGAYFAASDRDIETG